MVASLKPSDPDHTHCARRSLQASLVAPAALRHPRRARRCQSGSAAFLRWPLLRFLIAVFVVNVATTA